MRYLALGDSISIDDYTGIVGGGAASQFARMIGADEHDNRGHDGCTTDVVIEELQRVDYRPDVVTLTVGGNDFLQNVFWIGGQRVATPALWSQVSRRPLTNLQVIASRLASFRCLVIINTVYDPTDGDDELAPVVGVLGDPADYRPAFNAINEGIRASARAHGFVLSDLLALFHGHGIGSDENWFTGQIEPNLAGATAVAKQWYDLYREANKHPL